MIFTPKLLQKSIKERRKPKPYVPPPPKQIKIKQIKTKAKAELLEFSQDAAEVTWWEEP